MSETEAAESEIDNGTLSEPEGEKVYPEPERGWQDTSWPEPEPDWSVAFKEWGSAWHFHVYFIGTAFLAIALVTIFSLSFYVRDRQTLRQGVMTFSLQCLLLFFSGLRSVSMFVDPYHTSSRLPNVASNAIWSVAMPALTASFSVLLLVLLDTTRMTLGPPKFQKLSVILKFTACHFLVVIISDGAFLLKACFKPMLLICRVLFILYGLTLGIGYWYSAFTVYKRCKAGTINVADNVKVYRIVRVAIVGSVTAFAIALSYTYAASSEFGIYSGATFVEAWDWWIFQTCIRLEEIIACCVILTVAFRNPLSQQCTVMRWISKYTNRRPSPSEIKLPKPATNSVGVSEHSEQTTLAHIQLPLV